MKKTLNDFSENRIGLLDSALMNNIHGGVSEKCYKYIYDDESGELIAVVEIDCP